jgi:hypothetical protein
MSNIATELSFVIFVSSFLAVLTYLMSLLPVTMQFINAFDFFFLGGGIIGVAGTCAIVTGLPCAGALIVFGLISVYQYVIVEDAILKLLIFTPLIIGLLYVVSRLARGGG